MGVEDSILQSIGIRAQMYRDKGANHTLNSQRIASAVAALGEKLGDVAKEYKSNKKQAEEEADAKAVADFELAHGQVSDDPQAFMEDLGKLPTKTGAGAQLKLSAALRRQAMAEKAKAAVADDEIRSVQKATAEFKLKSMQEDEARSTRQRAFFKTLGAERPDPNPDQQEPGYFGEMGANPMISDIQNADPAQLYKMMVASGEFDANDLEFYAQVARQYENDRSDAEAALAKNAEAARHNKELEDLRALADERGYQLGLTNAELAKTKRLAAAKADAVKAGLSREKWDFQKERLTKMDAQTMELNKARIQKWSNDTAIAMANSTNDVVGSKFRAEMMALRQSLANLKAEDAGEIDDEMFEELKNRTNAIIDKYNNGLKLNPGVDAGPQPVIVTPGMKWNDYNGGK